MEHGEVRARGAARRRAELRRAERSIGTAALKIGELWIYPVKSLRGVRVTSARMLPAGLERDRRWMVVVERAFVTQRQHPELVRVRASIEQGEIVLRGGGDPLVLPAAPKGAREDVTVWASTVPAVIFHEADAWIARETGLPKAHLAFMPSDVTRAVTSKAGRPGDVVSFADAFPYLAANEASLADLDTKLRAAGAEPVTMERFRPNLVIAGARAWEEDDWSSLRVGDFVFEARKPCDRCAVTTVDPETGKTGSEPLKTLATFREKESRVYFGVNLTCARGPFGDELRVGDDVVVTP